MTRFAIRFASLAALTTLVWTADLYAATPHDPYTYWLPSGKVEAVSSGFTVKPRRTRMGVPDADLVLVRPADAASVLTVALDGKQMPDRWVGAFFVIPASEFSGKEEFSIDLSAPVPSCKFYLTRDIREVPAAFRAGYEAALRQQFAGEWKAAQAAFIGLGLKDRRGDLGRLCRVRARYCSGELKSEQPGLSAKARYLLGLYCMENGFWEAAAREFEIATVLDPECADAWYMLADARAYRDGDLGDEVEPLIPLYRRSAELRKTEPNIWNIYVGIFRNMLVETDDGSGGSTKKRMTMADDTARRIRKEWEWTGTLLWAASRGSMKFGGTVKDIWEDFDNTDPRAFDRLWQPGEQDVFMKFFEGGPANALGHDCGPNRTAVVDIGTWCGWEVFLHEWNHTLDWSMITSENGVGVPVTHSSDWCGYQPIPSMGRGHASLNRYYITSGMYRAVKGSEADRPGFNTRWTVYEPFECEPGKGLQQAFIDENATDFPGALPIRALSDQEDPWIDLSRLLSPSSESVVAYASAYVYSPVRQKVRMWLGMNDGIKVWLNGRTAYGGIYRSIVLFDEADEPDQVVPTVVLEEGWNSVLVKVENLPKTREQLLALGRTKNGWGFSLRLCDMRNRALPGVKWATAKPGGWAPRPAFPDVSARAHYRWSDVSDDYTTLLPCLSAKDLAAWTGLRNIAISGDGLITASGCLQRNTLSEYERSDRALNNLLNWRFESAAVLRYADENGLPMDLVFLRPEAVETYLALMKLPVGRGITSHADRVIGYVRIDGLEDHPNGRTMLVVDTFLGDSLPLDEKDLLDISSL